MALFKNKWEIKSFAELSASVGDPSNTLTFRKSHRLPIKLQQGVKAAKNASGFFKRESLIKAPDFPNGFFIYDTATNVSYTAIPKDNFKADMQEFLGSSSLSTAAKSQLSASFAGTNWPSLIMQIDSSSVTSSADPDFPTASWYVPCAFIGNGAGALATVDRSSNHTGLALKSGGAYVTASVSDVEFTIPMETMSFTGTFESQSIKFASFTGSTFSNGFVSSATYESSSIYTPHGESETSASIIGRTFGSGSRNVHPRGLYTWINHSMYAKALGDGVGDVYDNDYKQDVLHFPSGSYVTSSVGVRYAKTDTSMSGASSLKTVYYVTGSLRSSGSQAIAFWDNTFGVYDGGTGQVVNNQGQGTHLFADAALTTPALEGIYTFVGLTNPSGSMVSCSLVDGIKARVPQFTGFKH